MRGRSAVHPHTRGEYANHGRSAPRPPGSPPHTWGIPLVHDSRSSSFRFTPTHVGNTPSPIPPVSPFPVHPHTRGEYGRGRVLDWIPDGSPPHTWGILGSSNGVGIKFRFTPTHVGNTLAAIESTMANTVHPHTRGEYGAPARIAAAIIGSPPHTWGIRRRTRTPDYARRFTPTHVGNTRSPVK